MEVVSFISAVPSTDMLDPRPPNQGGQQFWQARKTSKRDDVLGHLQTRLNDAKRANVPRNSSYSGQEPVNFDYFKSNK